MESDNVINNQKERYSSITVGLRDAVTSKKLIPIFNSLANSLGQYRHLTSLFANYLLIKKYQDREVIPLVDHNFYNQVWSCFSNKKEKLKNRNWNDIFIDFINQTDFQESSMSDKIDFRVRESTTKEMKIASVMHLKKMVHIKTRKIVLFEIKKKLLTTEKFQNIKNLEKDYKFNKLIWQLLNCITFIIFNLSNSNSKLVQVENDLRSILKNELINENLFNDIIESYQSKIYQSLNYNNSQSKSINNKNVKYLLSSSLSLFIPYLIELSNQIDKIKNNLNDSRLLKAIPSQFNILPVYKLQAGFVNLSYTSLCSIFENKKDIKNKKNKNINITINKENIIENVFNLSKIKNRNSDNWKIKQLQTNGYELKIKYISNNKPVGFNIDKLNDSGYDLNKPKNKINLFKERGLYQFNQKRIDVDNLSSHNDIDIQNKIRISCIDPGVSSMISIRDCLLDKMDNIKSIYDNSNTIDIKNKEYYLFIRNNKINDMERLRRKKRKYSTFLDDMNKEIGKTCNYHNFTNYVKCIFKHLRNMTLEKCRKGRKKCRFYGISKKESYLTHLANNIFNSEKIVNSCKFQYKYNKLSLEEKKALKIKIREKKENNRNIKNIVFFGDGEFKGNGFGHRSVPKKELLKKLASKGLVFLLDEYGSSKYCPGCGCQMKDVIGKYRVRHCSSVLSEGSANQCCLMDNNSCFECDRDNSATLNMMNCVREYLFNNSWPKHLKRKRGNSLDERIINIQNSTNMA